MAGAGEAAAARQYGGAPGPLGAGPAGGRGGEGAAPFGGIPLGGYGTAPFGATMTGSPYGGPMLTEGFAATSICEGGEARELAPGEGRGGEGGVRRTIGCCNM